MAQNPDLSGQYRRGMRDGVLWHLLSLSEIRDLPDQGAPGQPHWKVNPPIFLE